MSTNGGYVEVSADGLTSFQDGVSFTSYVSTVGTKENQVCSGRGLCGADGNCECFATNGDIYASSNGYGEAGTRGDCG